MPIESISMTSFRNHTETTMVFGPGINIIWGENGSGKTSVLEAIHILSTGRSFKTGRTLETIEESADATRIKGFFKTKNQTKEIVFGQAKDRRRKIAINNTPAQAKDLLLENQTVLLSPEEQEITKGTPGARRRFFDRLFSTVSKKYLNTIIEYTKTLKQRNALLKTKGTEEQLQLWDMSLAEKAEKLWFQRKVFLNKFALCLRTTSNIYNRGELTIGLIKNNEHPSRKEFLVELKKARQKERAIQTTSVGPHKDIYSLKA